MLDIQSTSERLREALEMAFDRWHAKAPEENTKAALARKVSALAGKPCTPQAVSGWFKTGRMDKVWITHVEQVLGTPLGFGGAEAFYATEALRGLMSRGLVPKFYEPAAHPELQKRIPGRWRPDFVVELDRGHLLLIEVKAAPIPVEAAKQQAEAYAKALGADYRIIGGSQVPVFEEAAKLADELAARPTTAPDPAGEQLALGGLDWLAEDERELLLAYRDLTIPEVRHEYAKPLLAKAEEMRRYRDFFQQHTGTTTAVPDEVLGHLRAPAHTPPEPQSKRRATRIDEAALPHGKPKPKKHAA